VTPPPQVAVVLAAYQAASTIDAALASVAAQTRPPAEVVVVDDASTDATAAAARRWAHTLALRVESRAANGGPGAARRQAVALAGAPLVAVLDADDCWLPHHLEVLTTRLPGPGWIVSARARDWRPGHHPSPPVTPSPRMPVRSRDRLARVVVPSPERQPAAIVRGNFVFTGALFWRADYERAGGYRPDAAGAEDWDLWIRMIRAGCRVRDAGPVTVLYRRAAGSLSTSLGAYRAALAVLDQARAGCTTAEERRAWHAARREHRARLALAEAFDLARSGQRGSRRRAARALAGPPAVAARAAALVVAPGPAARRRDRLAPA